MQGKIGMNNYKNNLEPLIDMARKEPVWDIPFRARKKRNKATRENLITNYVKHIRRTLYLLTESLKTKWGDSVGKGAAGDLSLIPGTHINVEGKTRLYRAVSDLHMCTKNCTLPLCTHTQ